MTRTEYLNEIAKRAGVGIATVYRYMSPTTQLKKPLAEKTIQQIQQAEESMGVFVARRERNDIRGTTRRYAVIMVDTIDDYVFVDKWAASYKAIKQIISYELNQLGIEKYDPLGDYALYIYDTEFDQDRLAALSYRQEPGVTAERGLDFDVWHDEYLTDAERAEFDAVPCKRI